MAPKRVLLTSLLLAFALLFGGLATAQSHDSLPCWNDWNAKQSIFDFVTKVSKEGKPAGINRHIGRRPIAAFGNSDGDLQMLQWTTAGQGPRLALYVHHTDAKREWAYDRMSGIGRLDKGLDQARENGWTVVDMKQEWKIIYPFEKR